MPRPLNVLLIAIDSLRADHLGCYGYPHPTTPFMDQISSEGLLCERLFCSAIPTHPSFTTLFTGQHAVTHGVLAHGGKTNLAVDAPFLPQCFLEAGYVTCAVDNLWRGRPWFGRGYEYYIDPSIRRTLLLSATCEELNHRMIPWMNAHANEPFFIFIHYWDPHYPYTPPENLRHLFYNGKNPTNPDNHSLDPFWLQHIGSIARETWLRTSRGPVTDIDYVRALYAQEVLHVDSGVRSLIRTLDDLDLSEQTLVVIVADHGESLGEHGIYFDHYGLYDCILHVPLIFRMPGTLPANRRIPALLQMQDIAPTILEAAGLSAPPKMEGKSFWPLLIGKETAWGNETVISLECTWQTNWSLRDNRYKLIAAPGESLSKNRNIELYDLYEDPKEEKNIAQDRPDVRIAMESELKEWIADKLQISGTDQDPLVKHGPSMASA